MGHTALQCYNQFNHAYHGESSSSQLAAFVAGSASSADYNWYPDTGATNHLTSDLSNLNLQYEEYVGTDQIHVGNRASLAITHIGSFSLPSSSKSFILQNVLHVPHITKNLILVSQFTKDNDCFLEFHPNFFCIKDRASGRILHCGPSKAGLYSFFPSPSRHHKCTAFVGERASLTDWHGRLGHPAFRTIRQVLSKFQLPFVANKTSNICSACQQGKSQQLPFTTTNHRSRFPLDLLFADVWGPSLIASINGARYYVSFVDDFSRYTWLFPISSKFDVFRIFSQFHILVERFSERKIKAIQSN